MTAGEGEGKSTCCIGLARAAVSLDLEVLLVDGDLRRRRLSGRGRSVQQRRRGLSELLAKGGWTTDDLGVEIVPGLHVRAAGAHGDHATSLLSGRRQPSSGGRLRPTTRCSSTLLPWPWAPTPR